MDEPWAEDTKANVVLQDLTPSFRRSTKAYGQFLGRDFNPLAQLLLLRTPGPFDPKNRS